MDVHIVGDERTHDRFLVDRLLFSMREVVPEQRADPEVAKPMIVAVDDAPFRSSSDCFCDAAASLTRPPSVE
jgi:hypothetical protein